MTRRIRALSCLVRVREAEKKTARRHLVSAQQAEQEAHATVLAAENRLNEERHLSSQDETGKNDFRAWFPAGLTAIEQAQDIHRQKTASLEETRLTTLQASLAHKVTHHLLQRRENALQDARIRQERTELDEVSLRRHLIGALNT